jgi:ABC-type glycerol-3-phosphate transport system permease component
MHAMARGQGNRALSGQALWSTLAAGLILFVVLAPFYWVLNIALTSEEQSFSHGIHYLPIGFTLQNFFGIFEAVAFGRAFVNSVVVAVSVTTLAIALSVFAGYAFARFNFRGRRLLIVSLLLIYMLPSILLLVPMMVIFRTLGILNTYPALILAESTHAVPFAVWLLTNYFASLPRELEEAAQVDGCDRVGALVRIALPLAVPGLVAAALFVFIASWNNFLFAFMFTSGENARTLPVLLRMFAMGESSVQWGKIMAGAVLTTLPVAAAFLFFQRYLIRGLAAGAVKG